MAKNLVVAAIVMEKGGVGKTTVALNLAVAALQNGRNAAVIDIDPQATASNWTDRRTQEKPWIVPTPTARLTAAIEQAKAQGVDFLVLDTPPHSGADSAEAARRADVVLVPVEPHLFTLETLPKLADLLKLAGNPPTLFVINKAAPQGTEASNAADYIKSKGLSVCPVILHLRAAHRHATNIGKVASEYEPDGKAAKEALQLYTYTMQFVDSKRKSHGKAEPAHARA
jgi:chromosome partitioning protein